MGHGRDRRHQGETGAHAPCPPVSSLLILPLQIYASPRPFSAWAGRPLCSAPRVPFRSSAVQTSLRRTQGKRTGRPALCKRVAVCSPQTCSELLRGTRLPSVFAKRPPWPPSGSHSEPHCAPWEGLLPTVSSRTGSAGASPNAHGQPPHFWARHWGSAAARHPITGPSPAGGCPPPRSTPDVPSTQ